VLNRYCVQEALKIGSHILRALLHNQPDQQDGEILKSSYDEVNDNLEHKRKKITGSSLGLESKRILKRLVLNVNAQRTLSQKNNGVPKASFGYLSQAEYSNMCHKLQ
jgi:hypothetical protein